MVTDSNKFEHKNHVVLIKAPNFEQLSSTSTVCVYVKRSLAVVSPSAAVVLYKRLLVAAGPVVFARRTRETSGVAVPVVLGEIQAHLWW